MLDPFILYIMLEKVTRKREAKDPMSRMARYIEGCQQCMSLFFYYYFCIQKMEAYYVINCGNRNVKAFWICSTNQV